MTNRKPEVFIHVGMGKVGSTYLQYKVFPYFKGIKYIQRTQYKNSKKLIGQGKYNKYLVSREFDRQLFREVKDFSATFPDAKSIILLRQNDSWIASQYRRYLKNGGTQKFEEFIDLDHNQGAWEKEEVEFFPKIKFLEKSFTHKPLLLFYDDFRSNPIKFFRRIADYMGAEFNESEISLTLKHTSYNQQQLKAIRKVSKRINLHKRYDFNSKIAIVLWRIYISIIKYSTLYIAKYLPGNWFDDQPITPRAHMERIKNYYAEDWQKCIEYAKLHNPDGKG
jgi:hypothetical protein